MTDAEFERFLVDPARRLIMQFQEEARLRHETYEPTAEELRLVMIEALPETDGVKVWAQQLGCTPELLQAVLDGQLPPHGAMLDILGMEPIPERDGVYADPLLDRDARVIQQRRWSTAPTAETYRQPLRRIERSDPPEGVRSMFAIGVPAPIRKPGEEK
ncbi:hypothetical protein H0176_24185 [Methylorubrum populi]|uniref:Uncharacterized protein n=1 Tax=Methylorubrum rhodesianum TaxID=29427 RepID=A0ABU9Z5F6_9HYPH|nr:hypothetical protein [Methylorubrum rhodesianum]MBK3403254.1 hypothetical protein [Methylorubrum rhodesianum]MBY0143338.1 hypothetical protein [Methylorubrum populi]